MANHKTLAPFIRYYEGGFVNDKDDPGGATMRGITIATFRAVYGGKKTVNDLKKITDEQWNVIFKRYYWDKCKADLISNQSVANMLVDFAWHSGTGNAVPFVQAIVGAKADGIIGNATIAAINRYSSQESLFNQLKLVRMTFLRKRKTWWKYGNGWSKRVSAIGFGSLSYGGKTIKC